MTSKQHLCVGQQQFVVDVHGTTPFICPGHEGGGRYRQSPALIYALVHIGDPLEPVSGRIAHPDQTTPDPDPIMEHRQLTERLQKLQRPAAKPAMPRAPKPIPQRLRTRAWLLRGISSIPGELLLSGGRLSFTAEGYGSAWPFQLRRLERESAEVGLAKRIEQGTPARVFDLPLGEVQIVFPWYYFSGGLKVRGGGREYRISFGAQASSRGSVNVIGEMKEVWRMRANGKRWRVVLAGNIGADAD